MMNRYYNKLKELIYTDKHTNNKKINILSFDGGGMRGIFSLCILQRICRELYGNSEASGTRKLLANFDIICGTSTGSIITLGLTSGKSIDEIKKMYYELGIDLFSGNKYIYTPIRYGRYINNGNFYDGNLLYNIIDKDYKDLYLANIKKWKVFVPITNATTNDWQPYLSRSYDISGNIDTMQGTSNLTVSQTIRASCAAPTYFSPYQIKDKILVDGGCIANNPTELSIFESYLLYKDSKVGLILSIGTGLHSERNIGNHNILKILDGFINICTDSDLIHKRVLNWTNINSINYFRFDPINVGDILLDEVRSHVLENGEIMTENYMKSCDIKINKLKLLLH